MTRGNFVRRLVCNRYAIGYSSVSAGMTRGIFVLGAVGFVTRSPCSVSAGMTRGIFVPGAVGFVTRSPCSVSAGMTRGIFVPGAGGS